MSFPLIKHRRGIAHLGQNPKNETKKKCMRQWWRWRLAAGRIESFMSLDRTVTPNWTNHVTGKLQQLFYVIDYLYGMAQVE